MKSKLNTLTSLRFFAATMIVVHHSKGVLWVSKDFFPHLLLNQGVSFFFVLSGFILTYKYPSFSNIKSILHFWGSRIARIWPAHAVAFLLWFMVFFPWSFQLIKQDANSWVAVANLLMVHAWIPVKEVFFSFNEVSWSISTEFGFYLLFPFLIADFEHTWKWKLVVSALIVIALIIVSNILKIPSDREADNAISYPGLLYVNPLGRLFEFVLGMIACRVWTKSMQCWPSHFVLASIIEIMATIILIGSFMWTSCFDMLAFWVAKQDWVFTYSCIERLNGWIGIAGWSYLMESGSCISFAAFIVIMAGQKGILSRILSYKILVFLGEISYSVYLFHQIILRYYLVYLYQGYSMYLESFRYMFFWIVLLTISTLVWRFVEKPARHSIRLALFRVIDGIDHVLYRSGSVV